MFSPEQLLQIRQIFAEESKEALLRHHNHRSIVIYGLPEGDSTKQVHSILAHANVSPEHICVLHRLGNPTLGRIRLLKVDLREGIPMPSLRDLARKLSNDATTRSFHVRLLETPRQRKEGFEKREAKRHADKESEVPIPEEPVKICLEMSAVSSINFEPEPQPITVISLSSDSIDSSQPVSITISEKVDNITYPCDSVALHMQHLGNIDLDNVPELYRYFRGISNHLQGPVSNAFFNRYNFRLNYSRRQSWPLPFGQNFG